jgi:hypothetical protein
VIALQRRICASLHGFNREFLSNCESCLILQVRGWGPPETPMRLMTPAAFL